MSTNNIFKISITDNSIDIVSKERKEINKIEDVQETLQKQYIEYMDTVVEQIKSMNWGDKISIDSEPYIKIAKKRYCIITKNVRFQTYIFSGTGSKKLLRYFINKTQYDSNYGYKKIIQIINSKSYRQFIPIKCLKTFWNDYKCEPIKNRYLFEVILSDQPCKPYLDIEWKAINNSVRNKYKIFITRLTNDLKLIFTTRYDIIIDDTDILISTSHSKSKVSFHIVINKKHNDKLVVYETNKKGFSNSAWDLWVALVEHNKEYKKIIDESVYSTDREFRTLYSNKLKDFRPIVPYGTTIREDTKICLSTKKCLQYFVTYSDSDNYHYIKTPELDNKYVVMNKQYQYNIYPQRIYTDKKINDIIKLIKPYHETVVYTGQTACGTGWRFTYEDKNETCYTGNTHKSNGFYVYENKDIGYMYMKCLSSKCTSIQILNKNTIIKKIF